MGDATRVTVTLFPRTDFGQQVHATPITVIYDPAVKFPWFIQDCGRYWCNRSLYRDGETRPSQGGTGGAAAAAFDPAVQSWLIPTNQTLPRQRLYRFDTNTDNAWIEFVANSILVQQDWHQDTTATTTSRRYQRDSDAHLESSWIAPVVDAIIAKNDWHTETVRTDLAKKYQRDTNTDNAWIQANLGVLDPAVQSWVIHTLQTYLRQRLYRTDTNTDNAWIEFVANSLLVQQDWHIDTTATATVRQFLRDALSYEDPPWQAPVVDALIAKNDWHTETTWTGPTKHYQRDTNTDNAWILASLPASFDATIQFPWFIQDQGRYVCDRSLYRDGEKRPSQAGTGTDPSTIPPLGREWYLDAYLPKSSRRYQRDTNICDAWLTDAAGLPPEPASHINWTQDTARTNVGKPYLRDTNTFDIWSSVSVDPSIIPALADWQLDTIQTPHGKAYKQDSNLDISWMAPTLDPATNAAIRSWQTDSSTYGRHKFYATDLIDASWVAKAQFDPALLIYTATDRYVQNRSLYQDGETRPNQGGTGSPPVAFDPSTQVWTMEGGIPSRRPRSAAWLNDLQTRSAFALLDSRATEPAYEQLASSFTFKSKFQHAPWLDQPIKSWITPVPFDANLVPHTFEERLRDKPKLHQWKDQVSQDWITFNTPPPPVFDESLRGLSFDARMFPRTSKPIYYEPDQPLQSWITAVPFDANLVPHASDDRSREQYKRHPWTEQISQDWIPSQVPPNSPPMGTWDIASYTFKALRPSPVWYQDPTCDQPAVLYDSSTTQPAFDQLAKPFTYKNRSHAPWMDGPSQDWLTVNIPTPVDARLVVHSSDDRLGEKRSRIPKFQVSYYPYLYDMSWVHDVIPLTDPVVVAPRLRPIAPIMSARRRTRRRR